jgi:two-component system, NtrC family, nitrogen regulation response regulator NtrX
MRGNTVLIVDDEKDITDLVSDILIDEGFHCVTAHDSEKALEIMQNKNITIVLLDIWLQGSNLDGLGVLEILAAKHPFIPVIMISGHGTIETAVNSIKMGAYDYIEKPFNSDKLAITVKRACEAIKLKRENSELKKKIVKKVDLTGKSDAIVQLQSLIDKVALTSSRIMINGCAGSGRELVAKLIHRKSPRRNHAFVKLNTSILSSEKIRKELFGSNNDNFGLIELANKGTLFINEVGDLPLYVQHKLLTVIKEQDPDKDSMSSNRDIRIIVSTSKDLKHEVKTGNFLQDLYYRLNVIPIEIPSLKDRKEDIVDLCNHFMKYFERTANLPSRKIANAAIEVLINYSWPGSVRQLKNLIEWLLINAKVTNVSTINVDMLPQHILNKKEETTTTFDSEAELTSMPLRQARKVFEKRYLSAQMLKFNNNISKTSLFVGMERSALHRKLKLLNMHHNDSIVKTVTEVS